MSDRTRECTFEGKTWTFYVPTPMVGFERISTPVTRDLGQVSPRGLVRDREDMESRGNKVKTPSPC